MSLYRADTRFLHDLMVRTIEARRKHPKAYMWALLEEVTELQQAMEMHHDPDRIREECLDVAAVAMRIANEIAYHFTNETFPVQSIVLHNPQETPPLGDSPLKD